MEPEEEEEMRDEVGELPPPPLCPPDVIDALLEAKRTDPSKFASLWEMDEQDLDEATEEQIQNDPVTRVLWAAEENEVTILKDMLVSDQTLVNAKDNDGYTPLHRAAYSNNLQVMEVLLEAGADVHAQTNDKWTPLHSACRWDQTDAAHLLICCGANVNAQTSGGQTPLHLAAANATKDSRLLELLLSNRYIDVSIKNCVNETARSICQRSNPYSDLFEMAESHVITLKP